jgi:hypothetical protein
VYFVVLGFGAAWLPVACALVVLDVLGIDDLLRLGKNSTKRKK